MLLYFHQKLAELHLTPQEFFRIAYLHQFGKIQELVEDIADHQKTGRLPPYVVRYLRHLQGETS